MANDEAFAPDPLGQAIGRHWPAVMLRGVLAILLGLIAVLMPDVALASLALLFGVYMLVDGVLAIGAAITAARSHRRWGWLVAEGVLDLVAGAIAVLWPGIAVYAFVLLAGWWGILSGAAMLATAFGIGGVPGRLPLGLAGLFSIVWGILFVLFPISGAFVAALWIAAYALVFGVMLCALAFRLRQAAR